MAAAPGAAACPGRQQQPTRSFRARAFTSRSTPTDRTTRRENRQSSPGASGNGSTAPTPPGSDKPAHTESSRPSHMTQRRRARLPRGCYRRARWLCTSTAPSTSSWSRRWSPPGRSRACRQIRGSGRRTVTGAKRREAGVEGTALTVPKPAMLRVAVARPRQVPRSATSFAQPSPRWTASQPNRHLVLRRTLTGPLAVPAERPVLRVPRQGPSRSAGRIQHQRAIRTGVPGGTLLERPAPQDSVRDLTKGSRGHDRRQFGHEVLRPDDRRRPAGAGEGARGQRASPARAAAGVGVPQLRLRRCCARTASETLTTQCTVRFWCQSTSCKRCRTASSTSTAGA